MGLKNFDGKVDTAYLKETAQQVEKVKLKGKNKYLSIGELAKVVGVSNQTLIYYDKIGLLEPSFIDPVNGYRYYSRNKIFFLTSVKYLKNAGFALKEIQKFLAKESIPEITKIYQKKLSEIDKEIMHLTESKKQIAGYINFFENLLVTKKEIKPALIGKIELKKIKPRQIVFIRKKIRFDYPSLMFLYNQLLAIVFENRLQVKDEIISIFHGGYTEIYHQKIDFELALELTQGAINPQIRTLPAHEYVTCIHKGKYPSSIETYLAMKKWVSDHHYQIKGPVMHFLLVPIASCENPNDTVFEIHLPVQKEVD